MKNISVQSFILVFILMFIDSYSQDIPKDTLYGKIKRVREKVIFLTKVENFRLLETDDENYGHPGFLGPKYSTWRFYDNWYKSPVIYYLNYDRLYDVNRNVTEETWYGKKDEFVGYFKYSYDEKQRLIKKIDSSDIDVDIVIHDFRDYGDHTYENITDINFEFNSFFRLFKRYYKGKLTQRKSLNDDGEVNEFFYDYNDFGKISTIKHRNNFRYMRMNENSKNREKVDTISIMNTQEIYHYDAQQRLVKKEYFDTFTYDDDGKPKYNGTELIVYKDAQNTEFYSVKNGENVLVKTIKTDSKGRLIERIHFGHDRINEELQITYQKDKIVKVICVEDETKTYKIDFSYKFDLNNNWVEIIKTVNGRDLFKWIREIEYY
jgi:hypothetical protein